MGLLDDAIREHLELQRRRGADPAIVERAEREALGPVRRAPEGADEAETDHEIDEDRDLAYDHEEHEWDEALPDEAAPSGPAAREPAARESAPRRFLRRSKRPPEPELAVEPFSELEPDFPDEPFDSAPEDRYAPLAPDEPAAAGTPQFEPEAPEPRLVPEAPEPDARELDRDPPEPLHARSAPPDALEEPRRAGREAPEPYRAAPPPHPAGGFAGDETVEYDVEDALEAGEGKEESDDMLEETPEFLQDTPDHDRLWFEQRPPRDFDFDG